MSRDCSSTRADPTVVELLFDNQAALLAGRILVVLAAVVLVAGGVFVLASVAVRMRRGHWLKRAGPFEVSDNVVGKVDRQVLFLEETVANQQLRIAELDGLVSVASRVVSSLREGERDS